MARFDPDHSAIARIPHRAEVRDALQAMAERVQARAAQITAAEAVNTGLMAASWRVHAALEGRGWRVRILNHARSPEGAPYPVFQEFGWRHHRSGRHIPGKRILGRALDAARIS